MKLNWRNGERAPNRQETEVLTSDTSGARFAPAIVVPDVDLTDSTQHENLGVRFEQREEPSVADEAMPEAAPAQPDPTTRINQALDEIGEHVGDYREQLDQIEYRLIDMRAGAGKMNLLDGLDVEVTNFWPDPDAVKKSAEPNWVPSLDLSELMTDDEDVDLADLDRRFEEFAAVEPDARARNWIERA